MKRYVFGWSMLAWGLVTLLLVAIQFGSVLLSHFSSTASHALQPAAFEDKK